MTMENEGDFSKRPPRGRRGTITTRPSRDSIVRSYAAQDAAKARNARLHSQEASQHYQESSFRAKERANQREMLEAMRKEEEERRAAEREYQRDRQAADARSHASMHGRQAPVAHPRRTRVVEPLTSQQSQERTLVSKQAYERERESRDVLSPTRPVRTSNRELIDARGSVDSRAFNEHNELVGYSIDDADRPRPAVDASNPKAKWHSHAGQGFASSRPSFDARPIRSKRTNLESLSDTISGRSSYASNRSAWATLPAFVRIAIPIIAILLVILLFILFF